MPLSHCRLRAFPALFQTLTGLPVSQFDSLFAQAVASETHSAQPSSTRSVCPIIQAGRPFKLDLVNEFLMTVVWLRHRPTQQALGELFGVSDTTAMRAVTRCEPLLESGSPAVTQPDPGRGHRKSLARILQEIPQIEVMETLSPDETESNRVEIVAL
jgi:hypothetical protein